MTKTTTREILDRIDAALEPDWRYLVDNLAGVEGISPSCCNSIPRVVIGRRILHAPQTPLCEDERGGADRDHDHDGATLKEAVYCWSSHDDYGDVCPYYEPEDDLGLCGLHLQEITGREIAPSDRHPHITQRGSQGESQPEYLARIRAVLAAS